MVKCGLLMAAVLLASSVAAGSAPVQTSSYSGKGDYQVYCSSCHGTGGKGDGTISRSMKKRPPDLTQLAKLNNGVFPDERVLKNVNSRLPGSAHGDSDMPAWGDVFAKSADSQGADNAAVRIRTLVTYLETLQVKQ